METGEKLRHDGWLLLCHKMHDARVSGASNWLQPREQSEDPLAARREGRGRGEGGKMPGMRKKGLTDKY